MTPDIMPVRRRSTFVALLGPLILGLVLVMFWAPECAGYSVLTHEAIIDAAWKDSVVPLLLKRFPNATAEELLQAHEYAYGGAIIQDLGYAADNSGHRLATNQALAILYPGLEKKYGPVVTYAEKPSAHMKVEYGFDVDQVAKGHCAPKAYHDFIGFQVSKPVLERAFAKTYSLEMSSVFGSVDLALGTYRHSVSTKVAWHLKKDEIQHSDPSETKTKYVYNISNSGYRKDWGHVTGAADYRLTDDTYAELLQKTSGKPISSALRQDLLSYYADLGKPYATKRNAKAWRELVRELDTLKSVPVARVLTN